MLTREKITREELYEAVWKEPVQKVAASLGLSDVGLAKIAKKLRVPLPGRGYWARGPMARKVLKQSLPYVRPDFPTVFRSVQATAAEQQQKELDARQHLFEAGIVLPTVAVGTEECTRDPVIEASRPLLISSGLDADSLRKREACVDITVSPVMVDRAMQILHQVSGAFSRSGFELEVIPPILGSSGSPVASRTGVLILDCFVAFDLREAYQNVELPPPPPDPVAKTSRRRWEPERISLPPPKQYGKEGLGLLTLSILEPVEYRARYCWRDTKKHRVEECLNSFLLAVCDLARRRHEQSLQAERDRKERELQQEQDEAEKKRQSRRARRIFDLDSRLEDCLMASRIRDFVSRVRNEHSRNPGDAPAEAELEEWQTWATALAEELESVAIQTISKLRKPSKEEKNHTEHTSWREAQLLSELDLWQRRYIFGRHR